MAASYLIIGNCAAGIGALEAIRRVDREGDVTIVTAEPYHAYSRPLITYLLGGKVDEAQMPYRPKDFYEQMRARVMLGTRVEEIDPTRARVRTSAGEELAYDKLLIATGGQPILPPDVPGLDAQGVFTFTTWDDARAMASYIKDTAARSAVVIGGGLIGLKTVEALVALKIETTVVELAERVLAITLDEQASAMAAGALEKAGVKLLCSTTVKEVLTKAGKVTGVRLADGQELACDLVVVAIGVRPRLELAKSAGLKTGRGIVVNETMATSADGIWAAGDVAEALEIISGERRPVPIWPVAYRQGAVAGTLMAGGEDRYEGAIAMNSVEICGLPTISAGLTSPTGEGYRILTHLDESRGRYKKLVVDPEGRLVGYVLVGQVERAGILTALITRRVDVSGFVEELMPEGFGLMSLPEELRWELYKGQGA